MTLAIGSGIVASIVAMTLTSGIAAVASAVLTLFVLIMVALAVLPMVSSEWATHQNGSPSPSAQPSDD